MCGAQSECQDTYYAVTTAFTFKLCSWTPTYTSRLLSMITSGLIRVSRRVTMDETFDLMDEKIDLMTMI